MRRSSPCPYFRLHGPMALMFEDPQVAPLNSLKPPIHAFKMIDPEKTTFVILDELYNFGVLRKIVEDVLNKSIKIIHDGGRLSSDPSA